MGGGVVAGRAGVAHRVLDEGAAAGHSEAGRTAGAQVKRLEVLPIATRRIDRRRRRRMRVRLVMIPMVTPPVLLKMSVVVLVPSVYRRAHVNL